MPARFRHAVLFFLFVQAILPSTLRAEILVEIGQPGLMNLPAGSEALVTLLGYQVDGAALEIQTLVNQALDKPLVLGAFGDALSLSLLPLSRGPAWGGGLLSLTLDSGASLVGDTFDLETWKGRFGSLGPGSDFRIGLGLQPFTGRLSLGLDALLPGLSLTAVGGYFRYSPRQGADLRTWNALGGLSWLALRPWTPSRAFSWRGLLVDAAYGYSSNLLSVRLDLETVRKGFSFAPDPFLPLTYSVDIELRPSFDLVFESTTHTLPLQLSTGVDLFESLALTLGGGLSWSRGRASIALAGSQPVGLTIDSELGENFLDPDRPGTITLSGRSQGPFASLLSSYVFGAFEFRLGALYLQLPLLAYRFDGGLSARIGLGISL